MTIPEDSRSGWRSAGHPASNVLWWGSQDPRWWPKLPSAMCALPMDTKLDVTYLATLDSTLQVLLPSLSCCPSPPTIPTKIKAKREHKEHAMYTTGHQGLHSKAGRVGRESGAPLQKRKWREISKHAESRPNKNQRAFMTSPLDSSTTHS